MDTNGLRAEHAHLETATDAAVQLQELEWRRDGLTDDQLTPEYNVMFRKLKELNERSLGESLRHTAPRALFDMVRYAKHLGMWTGYEAHRYRLQYIEP